jgi:hypothetical protein
MTELKFHAPGEEPFAGYDVQLRSAGHWVAEQAPEEMVAALTAFLAPYREGSAAKTLRPDAVAAR